MGRPPNPTKITDRKMFALRRAGADLSEIASAAGISPEAVAWRLKHKWAWDRFPERKCELTECGRTFRPYGARQKCCCRAHIKRLHYRVTHKVVVREDICALPECTSAVLRRGKAIGRYCSREHSDLHYKRVGNGFYTKLWKS